MESKLIIGYPDTQQGDDALALGGELARILDSLPIVVTVLTWSPSLISREELENQLKAETAERFAVATDRLGVLGTQTRALASPNPAQALHDLAEEEDARAIVVGSSHRGTAGRVLLGSVGESLLSGAPCSVAVAPLGYAASDDHELRRIGVGFNGSPESWAALETAMGLADRLHAQVVVLSAADPERLTYGDALATLDAGRIHSLAREEKERLLRLAGSRAPKGVDVETKLLMGAPQYVLPQATDDLDLVISGSRGWGALRRTVLGSASTALMRQASCPVLVVPRASGLDPLRAFRPNRQAAPVAG
jgi:nucleotide-binding universal stress UspA family protein